MIRLKTESEIAVLRAGGRRLASIISRLAAEVAPGVITGSLDESARRLIADGGDEAAFLGYQPAGAATPYPAALCVSVNDEVVHGIPGARPLWPGDIVTLDLGLRHQGLYTDMAVTVPVGAATPAASDLLLATREALRAGVAAARPGARLGDIGAAISAAAKRRGLGVVRDFGGHGVGFAVHEEPLVPNYGSAGRGLKLSPGLVLAIEPMFTLGEPAVRVRDDGYTVATADGGLSAHYEQTVAVTADGPEILTPIDF